MAGTMKPEPFRRLIERARAVGIDTFNYENTRTPQSDRTLEAIVNEREAQAAAQAPSLMPKSFREDNLIGNVLTVIRDRQPQGEPDIVDIVNRFASEWGNGDFDEAEQAFWDAHGGPLCDEIMSSLGYEW